MTKTKPQFLAFFATLLFTALVAHSQAVHDGAGKWPLTASMVRSGVDAKHPNVYQNYTIHNPGSATGEQRSLILPNNLANVIITKCDIGGSGVIVGIFFSGGTNVSISGNTFHDINETGIAAYDTTMIGCHFDGNTFTNVMEGIHLGFGNGGTSHDNTVSYNTINGYWNCGIELQSVSIGGLKVIGNYLTANTSKSKGGIGLSIATGDFFAPAPGAFTRENEIASNTITNGWAGSGAIENYGSGTNIHNNYVKGPWQWGVMWDATGLAGPVPWNITNNVFIGCASLAADEGAFGSPKHATNVQPTQTGNQVFALTDPKAPPVPTAAATVGGAATQPTTKASADRPAVPPFAAVAQVDGIHVSNLPRTAGTLTWTADGNTGVPFADPKPGETGNVLVPAGAASVVITSIPNDWEVVLTFSGRPDGSVIVRANAAQQFTAVSASNPAAATAPGIAPATQPSPVLIGHSRDGVIWTVDATVQP